VIQFPDSIEVLCYSCFGQCLRLESVTFDCDSKLSRIEREAFHRSRLTAIPLPPLVEVIVNLAFQGALCFDPSHLLAIRHCC
jgi:hypothetical protein